MTALIVRTKVSNSLTTNIPILDCGLLKGTWFQIARWGIHEDLFRDTAYAEWTLIPRDRNYLSVSLETSDGANQKLYEGYATVTNDGIIKIILTIDDDVISLGEYLVQYTDYSQYTFLSAPDDLLVLSRRPLVLPSEVPILLAKSESYDYSGSQLYVNRKALTRANTKSSAVFEEKGIASPVFGFTIPFSNSERDDRQSHINTKISLDDEPHNVIRNDEIVSTYQRKREITPFEHIPVIRIKR